MRAATLSLVADGIEYSKNTFLGTVWPVLQPLFPAGELIPAEGVGEPVARQLDFVGIDYLFVPKGGEPYGLGQRVHRGSWNTVTMSVASLERLHHVWGKPGALVPAVLVHAYVTVASEQEQLRSAIVFRTSALLTYAASHPGTERENRNQGSKFFVWDFAELEKAGVSDFTLPTSTLADPLSILTPQ